MADASSINVKKMKVAELKKELALHGLDIKGNKSDLQARLKEFLHQQGLDLDHTEGDENDVDDELDHDEAEDLLADETIEQKTEIASPTVENENKDPVIEEKEKTEPPVSVDPVKKITKIEHPVKPLTEEEKRLQRIKRFGGAANEDDKKLVRSQRFGAGAGLSSPATESTDIAKLKKRTERFGAVSPVVAKSDEQDRLMKRKARFGTSITAPSDSSVEAKKKKRAERFQL